MNGKWIVWLAALGGLTGVLLVGGKAQAVAEKKMIGELGRLGNDGRDWLILGVEAEGFEDLSLEQKKLAYYLYRAAIAGNDIFYLQNHRYALEIKALLEAIHLHADGLRPEVTDAIHDYLKYVWINHGQYDSVQGTKVVPNTLTFAMLTEAAEHAQARGADIELSSGETLKEKLARLEPSIFDKDFEPVRTEQGAGKDVIAESAVNFWDADITSADMESVLDFLEPEAQRAFQQGRRGEGRAAGVSHRRAFRSGASHHQPFSPPGVAACREREAGGRRESPPRLLPDR